ncbi:hypothetical protein H4R34_000009 [Dimargaris verticillata]|uniref:Mis12 protein-domain-containing protein n=1 Tax=Dimargaris verticillata TaxID=2761393 RepID=A0A9W8B7Q8_9FUNG|nr:hypothetical protein H4R34_000009 [Dimargaris verticillata]
MASDSPTPMRRSVTLTPIKHSTTTPRKRQRSTVTGDQASTTPASMDDPETERRSELVIEHLGFSPVSCVDDIINAVNEVLYQTTASLERFLEAEMGSCAEVTQGMHQIETLLEQAVDKNFDIFELYSLRNIFNVPNNLTLTLPHYEGYDYSVTPEQEQSIDKEIAEMQQKIQAHLHQTMDQELAFIERELTHLTSLQEQLAFVSDTPRNHGVVSTSELLQFVVNQANALSKGALSAKPLVDESTLLVLPWSEPSERTQFLNRLARIQLAKLTEHLTP